jgi:hypothetical protein
MEVAIFGLVGVVIGGLLSGGVTWFMECKRQQATVKANSRLLVSLLLDAELSFDETFRNQRLGFETDLPARIEAIDQKEIVATISDDAALDLATAKYLIEQACRMSGPLSPDEAAEFREWADVIHVAVNALQPHAFPTKGPLPSFGLRHQREIQPAAELPPSD